MPFPKWLKPKIPTQQEIKKHRWFKWATPLFKHPEYWSFSGQPLCRGVFLGIFLAFVPLPIQMVLAILFGLWLRANLILAVALVWITNPLTMPPIYYLCYRVGKWIMHIHNSDMKNTTLSLNLALSKPHLILQPFLLGSLVLGLICASIAYIMIRLVWIFYLRHQHQTGAKK